MCFLSSNVLGPNISSTYENFPLKKKKILLSDHIWPQRMAKDITLTWVSYLARVVFFFFFDYFTNSYGYFDFTYHTKSFHWDLSRLRLSWKSLKFTKSLLTKILILKMWKSECFCKTIIDFLVSLPLKLVFSLGFWSFSLFCSSFSFSLSLSKKMHIIAQKNNCNKIFITFAIWIHIVICLQKIDKKPLIGNSNPFDDYTYLQTAK